MERSGMRYSVLPFRSTLSRFFPALFFVEKYVKYSGDQGLLELLNFYKCYRAYVRGKVTSFRLNDLSVSDEEKDAATKEATAYFELAAEYAKHL